MNPVSKNNDVTLFSNGIGHFRRVYAAPQGSEEAAVSIPFKTTSIGDVAASLQVFGNVKLNSPPSFTPANSHATSLKINQSAAMESLLTQLSGSKVSLQIAGATSEYELLGMDVTSMFQGESQVDVPYVVVLVAGRVSRFRLADIEHIEFKDESVQTEIEKALKSNYQKIKPDSTLLDLAVSSVGETEEFSVQYTIPVAAWKMRYAIREQGGKFSLEGAAIIDNNTDEDWDNFQVSVVTGNPISFSTDIANVVVPVRRFVQIVDQTSLGNVDVEEAVPKRARRAVTRSAPMMASSMGGLESVGGSMEMESMDAEDLDYGAMSSASGPEIESKEVGDFCIFTSKEKITILARKSAVVPMFSAPLNQADVVLFYKEQNHSTRPYRSINFKNETDYTLGKGKTVIYNEGVFSGECVLETTKPNDDKMLPHCLENSVKVFKESGSHDLRVSSIRVSKGLGITEQVRTTATTYTVSNSKDEDFKFALEHPTVLGGNNLSIAFDGVEIEEQERIPSGWRVHLKLPANETVSLQIIETRVDQSSVSISNNWNWFYTNIVDSDLHKLSDDKNVQKCLEMQRDIDDVCMKIKEAEQQVSDLMQDRNNVREDLRAAESIAAGDKLTGWVREIDEAKEQVRKLQKQVIPDLKKQRDSFQKGLQNSLLQLSVSWSDQDGTPKEVISQ